VVATNVGGVAEVVRDGETGFLVPPSNPEALADAMLRLMTLSESERHAMGQAGRAYVVANFDIEKIVDRWEHLYLQLLKQKGVM
ncbi:MAG: glycosyltransferase, partial [Armatimonadota bacterium]|nr:glycosyltransferase [Armatimonadota bacterium]